MQPRSCTDVCRRAWEEREKINKKGVINLSKYVFGIDVGGTTVKCGLFDMEGNVLDKWEIPTRKEEGGKHILPDVAAAICSKMEERSIDLTEVEGVGVGVPGPVSADGFVPRAVNLNWESVDVVKELGELTGMKVKAANDANVAALGEMWRGGAKGHLNVIFATLGTGVGGGIVVNGQVIAGAHGAGGEIGHVHINDDEEENCNCGNKGCLEQVTSATGIVRLANQLLAKSEEPSVLRGQEITAKAVFDAVKEGDALAQQVAEKFGEFLGKAFALFAGVVDPEVFVIGGGVSKAGPVLLDYIRKYYDMYAFSSCREAKLALAELGNDAGIYGAARMVLE